MKGKFLLIALLLAPVLALAEPINLRCTIVVSDENGNPANAQGARFYANGGLIADVDFSAAPPGGPTCAASVDIAPGVYDFTVSMYNDIGEGMQSLPTNYTVRPARTVPAQPEPPTVELGAAYGPPDREYFATTASRDSIHPDVPSGTRIRVWDLSGGVEVLSNGSTRVASSTASYSLAWSEETPSGWTEPREIIWN